MSNFPSKINLNQAPAVRGDFASQNPRASLLAGQGALVAPASGLIVGNFAFVAKTSTGELVSQSYTSGDEIGFLAREEQALISAYLAGDSLVVPQGFMITLYTEGDFYAYFGNGAAAGATVYADETTGAPTTTATNSFTGTLGFTGDASFATNVMTITTATAGTVSVGDTVTSSTVTAGTTVTAVLSGTPGAVGSTYSLSTAPGTIAAQAATTASYFLNVTAVAAGVVSPGDTLTATGFPSGGIVVVGYGSATGGVGTYTYTVNGLTVQENNTSETVSGPANVATGFKVASYAAAGEIAKITTWY
jgi:hypothetical protein